MIVNRSLLPIFLASFSHAQVAHRGLRNNNNIPPWSSASTPAYEVWASDQSNSVADAGGAGKKGSFLWIWDSEDIEAQLDDGDDAVPLSCTPGATTGPCDLLDVFPQDLEVLGGNPGETLADLPNFGRLHGMVKDPSNRYVSANIFTPSVSYHTSLALSFLLHATYLMHPILFVFLPNEYIGWVRWCN